MRWASLSLCLLYVNLYTDLCDIVVVFFSKITRYTLFMSLNLVHLRHYFFLAMTKFLLVLSFFSAKRSFKGFCMKLRKIFWGILIWQTWKGEGTRKKGEFVKKFKSTSEMGGVWRKCHKKRVFLTRNVFKLKISVFSKIWHFEKLIIVKI